MKKSFLLVALAVTLMLGSSFTVKKADPASFEAKKKVTSYIGSFNLIVDDDLELPIDVYGTLVGNSYIDIEVKHSVRNVWYSATGTVIISGGLTIADLSVTVPSGTFPYYGALN